MTTKIKFENVKFAAAARILSRKSGATVDQLVKGLGEHGVTTDKQARMLIDALRYRHGAEIENVAKGRFKMN